MTDKNQEILNAIQDIGFKDIEEELKKILKKYGLTLPYDLERNLDSIKRKFIQEEIEKANIHNIEKHEFEGKTLRHIDKLQEIKDIIKTHFSQLSNEDKIKESIEGLYLREFKRISDSEFKTYNIDSESYWGNVYKMDKKNNIISFSLGVYEKCSYRIGEYTNYHNHEYIRRLKFIVKEFLGIDWEVSNNIKTTMKDEDFNKWVKIKKVHNGVVVDKIEFKIYRNGRVDIKHPKVKNIFQAYKKYASSNYAFIE